MTLTNWFKSKFKRYSLLDEFENTDNHIFHTYNNFGNITNNRKYNKYHNINESRCTSGIISSNNKCNFKVQENSNRFFRTHAPNITNIISQAFGNNSYYSSIDNMIGYNHDLPKLRLPMIDNITYAIKHLESGYKDLNSFRNRVEGKINTKIDKIKSYKEQIESKIKEIIKLNEFTYKELIDIGLSNTATIQNIYYSNLFYCIIESLRHNNRFLEFDFEFIQRKNEKGEFLPSLTYKVLYSISQTNELDKRIIAKGSSNNIDNLKSDIENLLTSGNIELKGVIDLYYDEIAELTTDNDLKQFTNEIEKICSKIRIGEEQLKGKCKECPNWLDYF